MNNHKVSAVSPSALASVGRREPERSDGDRSTTDANAGVARDIHANPEVVAQAKRRQFTAEYKQRILGEVDQTQGSGGIGALLRREGLYSSLVTTWRREKEAGTLRALTPQKRGPKSRHDPVADENQQLRRDCQRLTEELRKADIVIDIQKKVAALLGRPILTPDPQEKR